MHALLLTHMTKEKLNSLAPRFFYDSPDLSVFPLFQTLYHKHTYMLLFGETTGGPEIPMSCVLTLSYMCSSKSRKSRGETWKRSRNRKDLQVGELSVPMLLGEKVGVVGKDKAPSCSKRSTVLIFTSFSFTQAAAAIHAIQEQSHLVGHHSVLGFS